MAITTNAPSVQFACPSWCTLTLGHDWDSTDDHGTSRGHEGPRFGPFISVGAREYSHAPGNLELDVHIYSDMEAQLAGQVDPATLRQLSRDALAAAEWLEAHQ